MPWDPSSGFWIGGGSIGQVLPGCAIATLTHGFIAMDYAMFMLSEPP